MSMIGKTLGHYQITNQLGKGGMGEVFQAKDQILGREVAIKVLPEEFARDADRVARFEREAKLLASLNHPNIAAIYGLEASEGRNFIVLELVEGDTLADRIKAGPIPVEESLKLALQIAEALEAAHEKGVVHRDLKPANIKITPDGKVKVLDFGLAKAYAGEQAELNLSNSPTLSDMATMQGVILGTAAYMSPEQAKGKAVDKRADIWAFGCVLYEMLTRRVAFRGEDVSEILASVIKGDVKLDLLPANLHPRVREALSRCLQRDLNKRYQDIRDARYEIEQTLADPSGVLVQPATMIKLRKKLRLGLQWFAAAIVLTAVIAATAVWRLKPSEARQVMRFYYELPEGQQLGNLFRQSNLAVSPDGKQFVYSTTKGLYLRSMDELNAKLIAGTEGDTRQPFFSPDGKWIGYFSFSDRQLKKIAINGGAPVTLCPVSAMMVGASWSADNTIVYGQGPGDIMRVSANGGTPETLIKTKSRSSIYPHILPGGKSVLYTDAANPAQTRVMVKSLESGEPRELFAGAAFGYLPTGHIVFGLSNSDSLFAIPFDLDAMEIKGGPVPIVEGVMGWGTQCAVSDSGTLVYMPGTYTASIAQRTLVWVDRNGKEEPLTLPTNMYSNPRISPDGKRVALSVVVSPGSSQDVWVWDFGLKTLTRLTFDKGEDGCPVWTPDGKRIAFHTHQKDARGSIYWKAADGTGKDEAVGSFPGSEIFPSSWSSDGKTLLVTAGYAGTAMDIGAQSVEGDKKYRPLLKEAYAEAQPHISRDGRWMAYASDESGQTQVYVRPFPDVNKGRWQVSASGGASPLWSPNGRELFYRNGDAVMAVPVRTEPVFTHEAAKILFRGTYYSAWPSDDWDIHPDGKRFLMIKGPEASPSGATAPRPKINIVLNWFEELKQRVPIK